LKISEIKNIYYYVIQGINYYTYLCIVNYYTL